MYQNSDSPFVILLATLGLVYEWKGILRQEHEDIMEGCLKNALHRVTGVINKQHVGYYNILSYIHGV